MARVKKVPNNVGKKFSTNDLIKAIADKAKNDGGMGISTEDIAKIIGFMEDSVSEALATGYKVQLRGFITIEPKYHKAGPGSVAVAGGIPENVFLTAKLGNRLKSTAKTIDQSVFAAIKSEYFRYRRQSITLKDADSAKLEDE